MIAFLITIAAPAQDAIALYKAGMKLKEEKKPAEALEKFKKSVSLKADYFEAIFEMGWCQNDLKQYVPAMNNLRKARAGWPKIAKVHFELGYAFEKQDLYDSARASYNQCLELKPGYSLAYKRLGTIAYQQDQYTAALTYFDSYISYTKDEINDYLFWYRKGFMENNEKKYTIAKESLQKSLMYREDYLNTYLELGYASTKLKEDDYAIDWFNKALKQDPKSHIPYNGIAEVYRDNKKDIDKAMEWYQKTLTVKTDERKACYGMGYCLNSKGKYSDAIPYLQKAIEKEPTYTAAFVELGYSYYKTGKETEALRQFEKALSLNPKNENARFYAGLVYISQKNKAMAQQMVDELKNLGSKNASLLQERVNKM